MRVREGIAGLGASVAIVAGIGATIRETIHQVDILRAEPTSLTATIGDENLTIDKIALLGILGVALTAGGVAIGGATIRNLTESESEKIETDASTSTSSTEHSYSVQFDD